MSVGNEESPGIPHPDSEAFAYKDRYIFLLPVAAVWTACVVRIMLLPTPFAYLLFGLLLASCKDALYPLYISLDFLLCIYDSCKGKEDNGLNQSCKNMKLHS